MRMTSFLAAFLLASAGAPPALAATLQQAASIAIPGAPMKVFGAIFVDPALHRAFLADLSNKSVDILDTNANKFVTRVGGFVGVRKGGGASGPQSVAVANEGRQVWATDGDSTVKVIDLSSGKIVDSIATGGKRRTGELAYDPLDHIMLATNPDERTQFVTLISTEPGYKILAKISFPAATEGIERSVYSPLTGRFYVPVPSLDKARTEGGIAEIDPRRGKLVALLRTTGCNPHSVQVVSRIRLYIGCNFGRPGPSGPKGQLAAFDLPHDRIVATGAGLGGDGETAIDPTLGQYYASANKNPGGPVLRVVDLADMRAIQTIRTWNGSHSVALDPGTHKLYLPAAAGVAPCGGCVVVYAPAAQ